MVSGFNAACANIVGANNISGDECELSIVSTLDREGRPAAEAGGVCLRLLEAADPLFGGDHQSAPGLIRGLEMDRRLGVY